MNNKLKALKPGSPEFVVAHAALRRKRRKNPSLSYNGAQNPRIALAFALADYKQQIRLRGQQARDAYRTQLDRLPIQNPTPEDMAQLCPHLTPEQAVAAFMKDDGESAYVALPPLRVHGAFQLVSYYGGTLDWSHTGRTRQSYHAEGAGKGDLFLDYAHMDEAVQYAEDHWGTELVHDTWRSFDTIYVQDPTDLNEHGHPKTKAVLHCVYGRDLNQVINDHSRPTHVQFDDTLVDCTLDEKVAQELQGGRGGFTHFACAYCGSSLGLTGCGGCGHTFKDDQYRCGGYSPLTEKMVVLLQASGHVFKKDPAIARAANEERWKEIQSQRQFRRA